MKKNKNIGWVFVVLVVLGLFLWLGQKKVSNPQNEVIKIENKDQLIASETMYDFGAISMKNGLTSKNFTVTNSSEAEIILKSVTTSCMCTVAYVKRADNIKKGPFGMPGHGGAVPKVNESIQAGESFEVEVVYDPNAHGPAGVGMIDRFVYLEDSNGKILELEIKANVTP